MLTIFSVLVFLLLFFVYFCIKFALIIINMQDVLEESLDKIDDKYNRINDILEIPVFFDSPEIRRLLEEIKDIRNVILDISYKISMTKSNEKEDRQED